MSIVYPLSLPDGVLPASVRITASAVVAAAASPFTLSEQVQVYPGQRWSAAFSYGPLSEEQAAALHTFLLKLNGRQGTFLLGDPARVSPRGVASGVPVVDGAGQSGNTLATRGWTAGVAVILKAGDFIQLGAGATARLYRVLDDTASDGAGKASLTLWPTLRASPADGAAIVTSAPRSVFRLSGNDMPYSIDDAIQYGVDFTAAEAL